MNEFQSENESKVPSVKIDDSIRNVQSEKLKALKAKRNNEKVISCLKQINEAAVENKNLMPVVLEAVENYCTLGEIADELRGVFGEFK
jgi:methylmalonyl-CoA mutase, N-terminal domain